MPSTIAVVKVGGSLFDLPELGQRLRRWLDDLPERHAILVPGGGPTADVIRELDQTHRLGDDIAHDLALRSLSLNAHVLAALLPGSKVVVDLAAFAPAWANEVTPILDPYPFLAAEDGRPERLPHSWDATSDAAAARVASVTAASRLILLKSLSIPSGLSWSEAAELGHVDRVFARLVQGAGYEVRALNFREWSP
jgi:aspartokinase-like uncharacterized kinase